MPGLASDLDVGGGPPANRFARRSQSASAHESWPARPHAAPEVSGVAAAAWWCPAPMPATIMSGLAAAMSWRRLGLGMRRRSWSGRPVPGSVLPGPAQQSDWTQSGAVGSGQRRCPSLKCGKALAAGL